MYIAILTVLAGTVLASTMLGCTAGSDTGPLDTGEPPALSWSPVLEADSRGAFLSAWGPSADDVWVVGGQPEAGVVLRGNTAGFEDVPLPEGTPLLDWVHGTSASDLWVAGLTGTLLHWDGSGWTDHSLPVEEAFWGVYAASSDSVVAVGGESAWGGSTAMAWTWSGGSWVRVELPEDMAEVSNLYKVRQVAGSWWVVGTGGVALSGPAPDQLASVATGTTADLVTVHGSEGGRVVVVGGRGTGVVLEEADGALAVSLQAGAGLNGVVMVDETRAVVAGELGTAGIVDLDADSIDDHPAPTTDVIHGLWHDGDDGLWAVGGNLYTAEDSFEGSVFHGTLAP